MEKAFDSVLQSEVDAAVIAKTSYRLFEECGRYQCLCCGEEVYLAAVESRERTPHFRHRRGNNDTKCEQYLGQPGAVERYVQLRKHKEYRIEFCFNWDRRTFEIGVSFTEEELQEYEKENSRMMISSNYCSEPFLSIPINKGIFIPGEKNYFTIKEFAKEYIVSFDHMFNRYIYQDVMRDKEKINIFNVKIQDVHFRHQNSSLLYTNTEYIGISENEATIQKLVALKYVTSDAGVFSFDTENRVFYGLKFSIKRAEFFVLDFFQKYDYQIETSESFSILWPPVYSRNSHSICAGDTVYVQSSFDLIPHGNINVENAFVRDICKNVLQLHINDEIIVREKNIDISIQKEMELEMETVLEEHVTIYCDKYVVPNQYDYFLFDQSGCTRLYSGTNVYLSKLDCIIGYKNGHIKVFVFACLKEKKDTRKLINDILKYHPQSEVFEPDDFMEVVADETVLAYLENCYRNGRINTVVKQYIKEGLI